MSAVPVMIAGLFVVSPLGRAPTTGFAGKAGNRSVRMAGLSIGEEE
jgi:hypothetical protein